MHVLPRSAAAGSGVERAAVEGAELLTPREAEVVRLLADGKTNAQIAYRLSIGVETVRTHARSIYRKLGVGSRRELRSLGVRGPIVEGEHEQAQDMGTRHGDEGHRGERGAAREGAPEAGLRGGAGSRRPRPRPATTEPPPPRGPRPKRPVTKTSTELPPGHVRKRATGEIGKVEAVDSRAGTARVRWLKRGASSTVRLSEISRR